ncbi:MAG: non-canonical purine NTP pyrophosphatase [Propionibacteriaceae bacterium]
MSGTVTESRQIVLATGNAKKLVELRRVLGALDPTIEVLGLADVRRYLEPAETATTFEGNALLKARACVAATGRPALADDSGLTVDALNGMPGVRSARWSGPHATDASNNELLLRQLFDLPPERRGAAFVAALAFVLPSGVEHVRRAEMRGVLLEAPVGDNGFGYDPLFVADGQTVSNGVLDPAAKDAISHRGQAVRAIAPLVVATLRGA